MSCDKIYDRNYTKQDVEDYIFNLFNKERSDSISDNSIRITIWNAPDGSNHFAAEINKGVFTGVRGLLTYLKYLQIIPDIYINGDRVDALEFINSIKKDNE